MKCVICGQDFEGRGDKRTCSPKCQKKLQRAKVDKVEHKVDILENKVDKTAKVDTKVDKQDANPSGFWYLEENRINYIEDSLKRITIIPDERVAPKWYRSIDFNNLLDEIESKSIAQLEEESYYIPAWKVGGSKHVSRKN